MQVSHVLHVVTSKDARRHPRNGPVDHVTALYHVVEAEDSSRQMRHDGEICGWPKRKL